MFPWVKVVPQGFGRITTIARLFHAVNTLTVINVLLVAITLPSFYTLNCEISLMMIMIIAKDYDL